MRQVTCWLKSTYGNPFLENRGSTPRAGLRPMTDRKNLKIDAEMYDRLREAKTQYETWNAFFDRLLSEAGADE